jgi:hypothetical protein
MLIGQNFEDKVKRKEQDYRNKQLLTKISQAGKKESELA